MAQAAGGVDRYIRMLLKYLDKEKFENILVCSQDFNREDYDGLVDSFEQIGMNRAIGVSDLNSIKEVRRLIQLFQSTHIFNRETGAMSQLAESSTKQWRLADTFVCGRGVPIGKFVRPYLHFKGKEQGRIDLTLTL